MFPIVHIVPWTLVIDENFYSAVLNLNNFWYYWYIHIVLFGCVGEIKHDKRPFRIVLWLQQYTVDAGIKTKFDPTIFSTIHQ